MRDCGCKDWRERVRAKLLEATDRMHLIRATHGARRSVADAVRMLDDRAPCCRPREPRRPQPDETETLL